mmetsp:Transcript_53791/g.141862  ORF Transcript_53791/g.141862 Transcript_53791/m.141862 type:complete len:297 (+) Transcript_53791:319-1209(+)
MSAAHRHVLHLCDRHVALHVAMGGDVPLSALHLYARAKAAHAPRPYALRLHQRGVVVQVRGPERVAHSRHHDRSNGGVREGLGRQLHLLASGPAARGLLRGGRVPSVRLLRGVGGVGVVPEQRVRGHGVRRAGRRDPGLVAHHARRELAMAAARAARPHVALDAAQVHAADEAREAAVGEVGAPRVLPRPVLHARGLVGAPAHELDAVAANSRRALGVVEDPLRVLVEEVVEVRVVVDARLQRAVGHHLDLHLPHLAVHRSPLGPGARLVGPGPVEGLVVHPDAAGRQIFLHDPTE